MHAYSKFLAICICFWLLACTDNSTENKEKAESVTIETPEKEQSQESSSAIDDLTAFKVLSLYQDQYRDELALRLNFSLPVKASTQLKQQAVVYKLDSGSGEALETVKGSWILSDDGRQLYFPYLEPEQEYQVYLSANLATTNGRILGQDYRQNIRIGYFEPKLRFISQGSTVLRQSGVLPIEAVNVSQVDVKFWKLKPSQYQSFFARSSLSNSYQLQSLKRIADLVHTGRYELDSKPNVTAKHQIKVSEIKALADNGLYAVTMQSANDYPYNYAFNWFVISDIGLHSRQYKDQFIVFSHQLDSAKPYANVDITLIDSEANEIADTKTDQSGFAEFNSTELKKARFLIATYGKNTNILRLNGPRLDLSDFKLSSRKQQSQELFLYAPRDLYRPGETVSINGLLRDFDANLVPATPIFVEIKKPDNKVFRSFNWQGDASSFYQTQFQLPADAIRGQWRFVARLGNKTQFDYVFHVEDFLPERLKLELRSKNAKVLSASQSPKIQIQSDYLYGAPAANNRFDGNLRIKAATNLSEEYVDYIFGSNHYRNFEQLINLEAGQLDEKGFAELDLKNQWQQTQFPLELKTNINVYESGGRPISRKIKQTVWPYPVAVGVRPLWKSQNGRDFARPNSNNLVELVAIDQSGQSVASKAMEVNLIRENAQYYWQWGSNGWNYRQSAKNQLVYTKALRFSQQQKETLALPLEYGNYRLEVKNSEGILISSYRFFAGWYWMDREAKGERPDQVKLSLNSEYITPGKEFELSIKSPFVGTALITIESDKLLWKKSIELDTEEQSINIPTAPDWQSHNLYASVMVIKASDVKRKYLPKRSYGLLHLPLERTEREFHFSLKHPEKLLPEQEFEVELEATSSLASNSFATLALVDTGVLNISDFDTPNPHQWFFAQRSYEASLKDNYGSLIELIDGKNARQKFGGDADLTRGGDASMSEVQIVSILADKLTFDAQGKAKAKIKLPYFNGELRLMALAFNQNQFGHAESKVKVAAPLVIQASLPRFLAKGDHSIAVIDIKNMEDFAQNIELQLTADNELGAATIVKKIKLAANEKSLIELPLNAKRHTGKANINLWAQVSSQSRNFAINRQWSLGFRPILPAHITAITKAVQPGKSFVIEPDLFKHFDTSGLKSVLNLSDKPPLNLSEHLQQLLAYPYGCLEQTTSRAWPLLLMEKSDIGNIGLKDKNNLYAQKDKLINAAISRILSMQRFDGSFGLWSNNHPENPWLTVFATDFLIKAKQYGYSFSEKSLDKAIKKLKGYSRNNSRLIQNSYVYNQAHYQLAYQAYAAYVLAGIKQVNLQDIRRLYDQSQDKAKSSLPFAHLALALELMGDEKRAKEAWSKALSFNNIAESYYYGDYGTLPRNLAQTIQLSLESRLVKSLSLDNLSKLELLRRSLEERRWLSTQERGALFRLAKSLNALNQANKQWQADLTIAGTPKSLTQKYDYFNGLSSDETTMPITINNSGDATLYMDYKVQGYPVSLPKDGSKQLFLKKNYFNLQGEPVDLSNLKTGDKLIVHIAVEIKDKYRRLPDAMLIDLLPAAFEIENPNLKHNYQIGDIKIGGQTIQEWSKHNQVEHQEFRDDRYVAAINLDRYRASNLFYMVRVVTPGKYKVPPALVEDMYRPEIRQYSGTIKDITVKEIGFKK